MCVTSTTRDTRPGKPSIKVFKGCAPSSQCPASGSRKYSVNLGYGLIRTALKCCDTNECNSETLSVPVFEPYNGQICRFCLPGTDQCSAPVLQCQGDETKCFVAKVADSSKQYPVLGCTTENVCSSANNLIKLLNKDGPHTLTKGPDCCDDKLCNIYNAPGLQCLTCKDPTDPRCSSVESVTCPQGHLCATASIQAFFPGVPSREIYKGCASSSKCPGPGFWTYSTNAGPSQSLASVRCCDKDNCNTDTLPGPVLLPENGLTCFACAPGDTDCKIIVKCRGSEDRCFRAIVNTPSNTSHLAGCTSANVCESSGRLGAFLYLDSVNSVVGQPICCNSSLCNKVTPPPHCPQTPSCPVIPPCPATPTPAPQEVVRQVSFLVSRLQNLLTSLQTLLQRLQNFLQNLLNQFKGLTNVVEQLQNLVRQLLSLIQSLQVQLKELEELLGKLQKPRRQCRCW
ncbi:unnamed protein product [Ophioblennius macclurei]